MSSELQELLVENLCLQLRNSGRDVRRIETHISYVLLTGDYAYKIRKDVKFDFLDFSTLARRLLDCEQELRLNQRYSPELYLEVVAICGDPSAPKFARVGDDASPILEYAVKMREFSQELLASRMLKKGELTIEHIKILARSVANFHNDCAIASACTLYGSAANIHDCVQKSISVIRPFLREDADIHEINRLEQWMERAYHTSLPVIQCRKNDGFVRECHGDLHLENIVVLDGKPQLFDCIEFNDDLRWSDVISEVAFLAMDLYVHGRGDFATVFLNAYLETSGDYSGLRLLRLYLVYRALVRAEVALLRTANDNDRLSLETYSRYRAYIDFAVTCVAPATPCLIMMHGFSGTGKTSFSSLLMESIVAIRVRSDVERKRVRGEGSDLYSRHAVDSTYQQLVSCADSVIDAGLNVVVDATFLRRIQRDRFVEYARHRKIPYLFVSLIASVEEMKRRLTARKQLGHDVSDADVAVLEQQMREQDSFSSDELAHVIIIDSSGDLQLAQDQISDRLRHLMSLQ